MRTQALFGIITVLLRAATLVFQSLIIGGIVFRRWIATDEMTPGHNLRSGTLVIRISAIVLAATQVLYLGLNTKILTASLGAGLSDIAGANFFLTGLVTIAAALAIAFLPGSRLARPGNLVTFLSLVVLACGALASHAFSRMEDRALLVACTAVHQCAAAVWIGGLPQLWISLHATAPDSRSSVARRFSSMALISVLALFASGMAMALRYIDSPAAMYGTAYGIMLAAKGLFFLVLVAIGAANRRLVRCVDDERPRLRLRHFLEAEVGIGITAILAAASLTSQPPATDLRIGRVTGSEIYDRMKPVWPRLTSPALGEVTPSALQAIKRAAQAGLPLPSIHVPNAPADIAWSEYNHHWAGVFVLLVGLLAGVAQTRRFSGARYWPLLFIGLAALIFLRADPEGWPLGADSFSESIQDGGVLQHKAFAVLLVMFAIFELRVQLGKRSFPAAVYVFPAVCALGGALLLTHAHVLDNLKEQLLVELSHTPIAIAAVLAGWSRWLQVRLLKDDSMLAARIWPVCFVAIGAILLNYREA
ncbi:MAG TPA: CopD family protein [Candidatus Angelobacter sp.]